MTSSQIRPEDLSAAARERLAEANPELADRIKGDTSPKPAPKPVPVPAPADELAPRRRAGGTSTRAGAGARRAKRSTAGAVRTITRSAPAAEVGLPSLTALAMLMIGATLGTVIVAELLTPRGSAATSTIVGTIAGGIRRLADPADPLIPAS